MPSSEAPYRTPHWPPSHPCRGVGSDGDISGAVNVAPFAGLEMLIAGGTLGGGSIMMSIG